MRSVTNRNRRQTAEKRRKRRVFKGFLSFLLLVALLAGAFRFLVLPKVLFPRKYQALVEQYAAEYALPESLVYAVIKSESNFESAAVSHQEANGLMQILDSTGEWAAEKIGIADFKALTLFDPETNIHIGCWYLARLIGQFGNTETALAAYNAGEGNVGRWLSDPAFSDDGVTLKKIPYPDTADYVEVVMTREKVYRYLYE